VVRDLEIGQPISSRADKDGYTLGIMAAGQINYGRNEQIVAV
jgi:hypothetical protein